VRFQLDFAVQMLGHFFEGRDKIITVSASILSRPLKDTRPYAVLSLLLGRFGGFAANCFGCNPSF
jgi:hypothetical protein